MSNCSNSQIDKNKRLIEIKEILRGFCREYLNEELKNYITKLCDDLGRKRKINVLRGKKEVWAASIIYAISRLNFFSINERKERRAEINMKIAGRKKKNDDKQLRLFDDL
ncbi:MAG: hypothetical protein KKH34_01220 [Candidatus Omnitrophica bacterium]|nr:hypothetical protein [Candidatus Omnitrophota bacterium]MCG2702810.1 DUF6398 domain-containing protein [Candidatus Omnitrophota bacterium]